MEFARIAGGKAIAMDINDGRLAFCMDKLNVEHSINPKDCLLNSIPPKQKKETPLQ